MKKKFASQIARKFTKNAILLTIAGLALPISAAFGAPTIWTDATGSWFTCGNWSLGCPDSTTDAQINNGGTAQIFVQAPSANAKTLTLGLNTGDSGTVSVGTNNFGTLAVSDTIFVGEGGTGNLSITSGGAVSSVVASIASLTGDADSKGAVKVDGTGSTWTMTGRCEVGGYSGSPGGVALLSVTNSGTVTAASVYVYGSGTLTGNGTISTTNHTTVDGTLAPNWTLTIGGHLGLNPSATMQCSVTPQNLNQVDVSASGTAGLDGRVSVTMTGTFTPGTTFTLLNADGGVFGRFRSESINFPPGQNFTPKIIYDTHHVKLYLQSNT